MPTLDDERWNEGLKGPQDLDTGGCMALVGAVRKTRIRKGGGI